MAAERNSVSRTVRAHAREHLRIEELIPELPVEQLVMALLPSGLD
jgi:hypothetical protein